MGQAIISMLSEQSSETSFDKVVIKTNLGYGYLQAFFGENNFYKNLI